MKLKFDHPDFPKDHAFSIDGLGTFENGKSREVTEEQEAAFAGLRGLSTKEAFEGNEYVTLEGAAASKKGGES